MGARREEKRREEKRREEKRGRQERFSLFVFCWALDLGRKKKKVSTVTVEKKKVS